jgi:DNA ligase D-like protein (predicted polymerase)
VPAEQETLELSGRSVTITSPGKLYFADLGVTKLDLVRYYEAMAEALLAVAKGRPTMLQRFPEGAGGKSFFQKRVPSNIPPWLETTTVSTVTGTTSQALVLADLAHVAWAVNLGCLGFHLWASRAGDPLTVDELRIDLDPQPGVKLEEVREAARCTQALLEELGIVGFPKTTGNRGIHVYVPLEARWDGTVVRAAAVALARELEWWKEERGRRVFVDFNQNAPHKTVFGAWSVRARPGAQVSTPLRWDEVDDVEPDELTIRTVPGRLSRDGDPWAAYADRQSLEPLLELVARDQAAGLPDAPWPPEYPKAPGELTRVAPSRAKRADR